MQTELGVTLHGPSGAVDARHSLVRLAEILDLLGELEEVERRQETRRGPRRPPPHSRWTFSNLGLGSVRAALAPLSPRPGETFEDMDRVPVRAVEGFTQTEENEVLPDHWSVKAAKTARGLARHFGATPETGMTLFVLVDGQIKSSIDVTRRSAVHLGRALQVRRESIGSITGAIDSISVHKKPVAGLWSTHGGPRIIVELPTPELVDQARSVLGTEVVIRGRIRRNAGDQILGLRASRIEVSLATADAPPLSSLVGAVPDITGGLDPVLYMEAVREQA